MWLLTAGKAAISILTNLLNSLIKWVGYYFAYRLGRSKERAKSMQKAKETTDEQAKILARPDKHRSDLIDDSLRRKRDD